MAKELLPIILAAAVWAQSGFMVSCMCDNAAVVAIVNHASNVVRVLLGLMRHLLGVQSHV